MVLFILFAGFASSKLWWEYSDITKTSTLPKLDFVKQLKKIGKVYSFTSIFWNIDYYKINPNKKEKNQWTKIYKKYKPHSSNINFNLEDIDDDIICRKVHTDVRKKYGDKVKLIPVGHSYGVGIALLFAKMYKKECLCTISIDMGPLHTLKNYRKKLKDIRKKNGKMIKKYFNNNENLHKIINKIKNSLTTKKNVNKEIEMIYKLIEYKYTSFRVKNFDKKLSVPTLFFKVIYHAKDKKWDKIVNDNSIEEINEIKKNNKNSMYKYRYFLNGQHFIWFDQENSNDMISDIKLFINRYQEKS